MIITLGYRGVFRQAQYETAAVEGSLSVDSSADREWFEAMAGDELYPAMRAELYRLIRPVLADAVAASMYDENETVIYEWEGITDDAASDKAAPRKQGHRTRRGD